MLKKAAVISMCVLGLPATSEPQGQPATVPAARVASARSVRTRLIVPLHLRLVDSLSSKYLAAELHRKRNGELVAIINGSTLSAPVLADVIASLRAHAEGDRIYPQGISVTFVPRRSRPRAVASEDTDWLNDVMTKLRNAKRVTLTPGGRVEIDLTTGDS